MSNEHAQNVQGSGDHLNHVNSDKIRTLVLNKIYDYLMFRMQQRSSDVSTKRIINLSRVLENLLFDASLTLDEYMNMGTLENRLITTLVQLRNRRNQRLLQQQMNAGFGNQNQQLQQQLQVNSGFGNQNQQFVQHGIPTAGGFLGGCQQPSSVFPTTSGSNNMVSSMSDGERISSQMMPTPGFVNTNDTDAYSSLESTMVAGFQLLNI